MKKLLAVLTASTTAVALAACGSSWDDNATPAQADALAKTQVERLFNDVLKHNTSDLQEFLAPNFQLMRSNGTGADKKQYIGDLPTLKSFSLGPVHGLEYNGTLSATYTANTDLTVDGEPYSQGPNPVLSVFVKREGQWRLVGHGYFAAPKN
jgi:hypothetical protein